MITSIRLKKCEPGAHKKDEEMRGNNGEMSVILPSLFMYFT